jgi:hypothetical protein
VDDHDQLTHRHTMSAVYERFLDGGRTRRRKSPFRNPRWIFPFATASRSSSVSATRVCQPNSNRDLEGLAEDIA